MGEVIDYWREAQKKYRENQKKLKIRYNGPESFPGESFSAFVRRLKKEKQSAPF